MISGLYLFTELITAPKSMNSTLEIKFIEKPTSEEFTILDKFAEEHWGPSDGSSEDEAKNFFDKDKSAVLGYLNGELVGLCFIHFRKTNFNNKDLAFACIGGVLTHSQFRHQGIATKVLWKVMQIIKDKKSEFAILTTDIPRLGKLYANVGFEPLGRSYRFLDIDGVEKEDSGGMIAPAASTEIFKEIIASNEILFVGKSNF